MNPEATTFGLTIQLTGDERRELDRLEQVVLHGLDTFIEVGTALTAIRDGRLYRQTHTSFERYLQDRYDGRLSRRRADQLIAAAGVGTMVLGLGAPAPRTERQARELINLPAATAAAVMTAAEKSGTITSKSIAEAKDNIVHRARRRDIRRDYRQRTSDLDRVARSLERLSRDDRFKAFASSAEPGDRNDFWRSIKTLSDIWGTYFDPLQSRALLDDECIADEVTISNVVEIDDQLARGPGACR